MLPRVNSSPPKETRAFHLVETEPETVTCTPAIVPQSPVFNIVVREWERGVDLRELHAA